MQKKTICDYANSPNFLVTRKEQRNTVWRCCMLAALAYWHNNNKKNKTFKCIVENMVIPTFLLVNHKITVFQVWRLLINWKNIDRRNKWNIKCIKTCCWHNRKAQRSNEQGLHLRCILNTKWMAEQLNTFTFFVKGTIYSRIMGC